MFLESCPFLLGCQIYWHIIVHSILSWFFCISVVSVVISPLSFRILFIWVFSLSFLGSPDIGVLIFVYPFKEPALGFIDFFFLFFFLISILFISSLVFIISFFLLTLGFLWSHLLFFLSFSWPCRAACGILVSPLGIEPGPLELRARSPNHWTIREFPCLATSSVTKLGIWDSDS